MPPTKGEREHRIKNLLRTTEGRRTSVIHEVEGPSQADSPWDIVTIQHLQQWAQTDPDSFLSMIQKLREERDEFRDATTKYNTMMEERDTAVQETMTANKEIDQANNLARQWQNQCKEFQKQLNQVKREILQEDHTVADNDGEACRKYHTNRPPNQSNNSRPSPQTIRVLPVNISTRSGVGFIAAAVIILSFILFAVFGTSSISHLSGTNLLPLDGGKEARSMSTTALTPMEINILRDAPEGDFKYKIPLGKDSHGMPLTRLVNGKIGPVSWDVGAALRMTSEDE